MMQTAYYQLPLATKPQQPATMPAADSRASVTQLLAGACATPCSTAAHTFVQIVPPLSRFQLALEVLMPMLDARIELPQRILVAYILYSLYAPHPISINPFKSVLCATFIRERDVAVQVANSGGVGENEQLIWVLWKILKGDGSDIGPFSPNTLARSPLPPKLRAANLTFDEDTTVAPLPADPVGNADSSARSVNRESAQGPRWAEDASSERDQEMDKLSRAMTLLLAARDRVLTIAEQRTLLPAIPQLAAPPMVTSVDLPGIIANNPLIAHPLVSALLAADSEEGPDTHLDVLRRLPPALPSFDLMGRLLRDATAIMDGATGGRTTIADLVRTEVLGWFIHECVSWLDRAEQDERAGNVSDDRFAKGVQSLCRFYNALIKFAIVDPASDADSAEMAHFTLRNARFEEANALYRVLASAAGGF